MSFRFVHAADLHLDSPLRSLALCDKDLADLVADASRQALRAMVRLCLDERVDALLLSGDLYDGEQRSMKTARFLADQIDILHAAGVQVFMIRGNHDHMSQITQELTFPESVTLFRGRGLAVPARQELGKLPVVVHGISFADRHVPDSLLPKYLPPIEGAVNIGLLHTSLGGAAGHDPYAPCTSVDLHGMGYRYWALGHVHMRSVETEGATTIVMPGIPQGRDVGEAGSKSVTLARIADDGTITVEERRTSVAQFERVTVDLAGADDIHAVARRIGAALGQARDAVRTEHLIARLHLQGATSLAWQLRRDPALLLEESRREAGRLERTWIDKVEIGCTAPGAAAPTGGPDPLEELRGMMDDARQDPAFRAEMATILEELRRALPARYTLPAQTEEEETALLDLAAREGIADVFARLTGAAA